MAAADSGGSGSGAKLAKRYGPIVVVAAIIGGVIAFAGGGDDDSTGGTTTTTTSPAGVSGLPKTYQEAEADGTVDSIEWGDTCDTERGRLKVPTANPAPCLEPWDQSEGNGGATAPGVTAEEIVVVLYKGQPDPLQQAIVEGAGADTDPDAVNQTWQDYINLFTDVYETYGRSVRIEVVEASGGPDDATAAQADALKAIDLEPFAVLGGPTTATWYQEIANADILCVGCGTAETADKIAASAPYVWPTGPTPEQADAHLLEMIGKQLVGRPASFAGDEALHDTERVFGWIQAETETDEYGARNDAFETAFAEDYSGEIATRFTYLFDPGKGADIATTAIARMKDAGVTTIIMSVDPLIPANITQEATAQNYFPEWIIGPSVLADTTIFGRTFDQEQWSHALGLGLATARADRESTDSYRVYDWYYGEPPAVNSQAVIAPSPGLLALGIHLAGPNLTAETFKEGLFRAPPADAALTSARASWGEGLWPETDYNGADDATTIWWDPEATGKDEAGNESTDERKGMLRYVDGGRRYLPGEWPTDPIPWFEEEGSVTIYTERPDAAPDYPAWPGSPAAG
jgi:hypothetical protein